MTRRGSLAYYLAAWVCGCFFLSLGVWLLRQWGPAHGTPGFRGAAGFLFFYFLSLVFGAFTALSFGFLLRRLAAALRWKRLGHWIVAGAILAGILIGGLGALRRAAGLARLPAAIQYLAIVLLGAPAGISPRAIWAALPAGAATACLLFYINRRFETQTESSGP